MSSRIPQIQKGPKGPVLRGALSRTIVETFLRSPQKPGETNPAYRQRIDRYRTQLQKQNPQILLKKAFSNWRNPVLSEIRGSLSKAGLHDLYSTAQAGIAEHAARVLELNPPEPGLVRSDLDVAVLLFRSLCPANNCIVVNFTNPENNRSYTETIGYLRPEKGGIGVMYKEDRQDLHPLLPAAIINKPNGERFAVCHEHGALFVALLRSVGLNGQVKSSNGHTSVLLECAEGKYQFDLTSGSPRISRVPDERVASPDRRGIAYYYSYLAAKSSLPDTLEELSPAEAKARLETGLELADLATELFPADADNWVIRAENLLALGRVEEAIETAKTILENDKENTAAKDVIKRASKKRSYWGVIRWALTKLLKGEIKKVTLDPKIYLTPSELADRALILFSLGQLSAAQELAKAALEINQQEPVASYLLSRIKQYLGFWGILRWGLYRAVSFLNF